MQTENLKRDFGDIKKWNSQIWNGQYRNYLALVDCSFILDAVPSGKFLGVEMWLSLSKENNGKTHPTGLTISHPELRLVTRL
jgi:hypothetical protein